MKVDVSGSKDRTSNLKHEQHSYAFFASLHNLSTCEQIQTRTKPCDVLWTLLDMKIVRWVMPSCPEQLPMIDFDFMGPGRDNISWLWSMHVNALWKVTFLQTCTSFALVYLASLKVSAVPGCFFLFLAILVLTNKLRDKLQLQQRKCQKARSFLLDELWASILRSQRGLANTQWQVTSSYQAP